MQEGNKEFGFLHKWGLVELDSPGKTAFTAHGKSLRKCSAVVTNPTFPLLGSLFIKLCILIKVLMNEKSPFHPLPAHMCFRVNNKPSSSWLTLLGGSRYSWKVKKQVLNFSWVLTAMHSLFLWEKSQLFYVYQSWLQSQF